MQKTIYLGLGANLGDRESNLVEAIANLHPYVNVTKVSKTYETEPVGYTSQPPYLNIAIQATTNLLPQELCTYIKKIERKMGRQKSEIRYGPRPIDIDILIYEQEIYNTPELTIPHIELTKRAFVLVPMADLAPNLIPSGQNKTINQLLQQTNQNGVKLIDHGLLSGYARDLQNETPHIQIALDRVGINNLRRIICLTNTGKPRYLSAQLNLSIDLERSQKGAHMSRFGVAVEDAVTAIIQQKTTTIERLAAKIVKKLLNTQGALRAEVEIKTQFPITKRTPVSGIKSQEVYDLIGIAAGNKQKILSFVGIEAEGMTACPCAQNMIRDRAKKRLQEEKFTPKQINTILDTVPLPSHNQCGKGKLLISAHPAIKAENLVHIVEASMSSETYEILKRPDECFIVDRAHRNPKFVEDVVRDILAYIVDIYPELPDDTFIHARQTNLETIHKHNVYAERNALLSDIRSHLRGEQTKVPSITLQRWLDQNLGHINL